jgi:hypothetical protein
MITNVESDALRSEAIGRMLARGWREEQICEDELQEEMAAIEADESRELSVESQKGAGL